MFSAKILKIITITKEFFTHYLEWIYVILKRWVLYLKSSIHDNV